MPTVAVLMSTFNGERYIREQLDSIFEQENVDVKLFVRDDGSTDETVDIIREYAKRFQIKITIDGENVGPGEGFMRLVYKYAYEPGVDYYAFADQDDIWLLNKLSAAIEKIEKCVTDVPILYCSNQYIYLDGNNKGIRHREVQRIDLISHLTKNTIAGCTIVFNKLLAQLVTSAKRPYPKIIRYRLHDALMILVAICCGRVIYDESSFMLYRIHDRNVVGVKRTSIQEKINRLINLLMKRNNSNLRMITAQYLLESFSNFNPGVENILRMYSNYKRSLKNRWILATNRYILENCDEKPLIFIVKVLFGFI